MLQSKKIKQTCRKKKVATRDHTVKIISDIIAYGFYNVLHGPSKKSAIFVSLFYLLTLFFFFLEANFQ